MRFAQLSALLPALMLVAGCAAPRAAAPRAPLPPPPPPPAGTEALMGRTPEALLLMLGPATLDRREGPARQLQWSKPQCVLDLWFYPRENALLSTHAAGRGLDGTGLAAGECVRRLRAAAAGPAPSAPPPPPPANRRKRAARAR